MKRGVVALAFRVECREEFLCEQDPWFMLRVAGALLMLTSKAPLSRSHACHTSFWPRAWRAGKNLILRLKLIPLGVGSVNERNLFNPFFSLELLFTINAIFNLFKSFVVDQFIHFVLRSKTWPRSALMFDDSPLQTGSYPDV